MKKQKMMKSKNFLVSLLAIMATLLVMTVSVSAATSELADVESIKVNGIDELGNEDISVLAGEKISVEVVFEALENASDVRIQAEIQGSKVDSEVEAFLGDVEDGKRYTKTLVLRVPQELDDEQSDDFALNVEIWNKDFRTNLDEITLRVQRPSYNVDIMSVETSQTITAGQTFPVDIVLKNTGYNDLDDLYVEVSVPALELSSKAYFGDLVAIEEEVDDDNDRDDDTVRGRIFMNMPFSVESGIYNLEVRVSNEDLSLIEVKQVFVKNEIPGEVIKSGSGLILVNPTNQLKVYTLVSDSASFSERVVVVSAGSSKKVTVTPETSGDFNVDVFSGNKLVGKVAFTGTEDRGTSNAVVVLTIILAIIFVVLLVALIVLVTKKPEKEEFEESYY